MDNFWQNFLLEIALFTFLGILYYFYQKRRLVRYEENKRPLVMGFILQACLTEKRDLPQPELDALIEALDDYLHNRSAAPPLALLRRYAGLPACSAELRNVIAEGLAEVDDDGKK
jgi:hypothetical protein